MVGLQPPRGVTWEEVVSIYGCNFLLIEGKYYCELTSFHCLRLFFLLFTNLYMIIMIGYMYV